ncbi:hypothetical protein H072_10727 [Dactylellina haptotyla CBS 200.50]|uniref:G domain-containing protein n=1 Tax=Dactylellina haptotyla (strain CBS 200.50) TaxID=1284197 RepID=S8BKP9_DACHA|nr:hypothetical protein H072_10727 [Dactylellina haptotyla CBS 200.50]
MPRNRTRSLPQKPAYTRDLKNIVVLGLTQNGKSSFIESVLDYSGSKPLTPSRPATGRGTYSETKNVSKYPVLVDIKRFIMKRNDQRVDIRHDSEGSIVTMTYDENDNCISRKAEPLEWVQKTHPTTKTRYDVAQNFRLSPWELLKGLEPQEPSDSGSRLCLNMIDTPGLSDSSGIKTQIEEFIRSGMSAAEAEKAAFQASRNLVDEAHRLKIIQAISKISELHGVCLVIQRAKVFGEELAQLQLFVDMFKSTGIKVNYYIIHTKFTNTTMFQAPGLSRIKESEKFFGIQAEHFFINNRPDRTGDEPLSAHFADSELSRFFFHVHESPGVQACDLKFQKTDSSIDVALSSTLKSYISSLQIEDKDIQKSIKLLDQQILISESKIESYKQEIDKWKAKRKEFDKPDDLEIEKRESWVDSSFWDQWPSVDFDISTRYTISRVWPSEAGNRGQWISINASEYGKGTKRCQARFKAGWNQKAGGVIVVYGHMRDVKADDIKTLDEDCARVDRLISSEQGNLSKSHQKRNESNARRHVISEEITSLNTTIRDPIGLDYIPLHKLSESGHYLLTNDIYCMAEGYGLTPRIPAKLLPKPKGELKEQAIQLELSRQSRKHHHMEMVCSTVIKLLEEDLAEKARLLLNLKNTKERVIAQLGSEGSMHMLKELTTKNSNKFNFPNDLEIGRELAPYLRETYSKLRERHNSIENDIKRRSRYLKGIWDSALEELSPIISNLEQSISAGESSLEEWQLKKALHSFSQAAIEQFSKFHVNASDHSVGVFTILKRAIEKTWSVQPPSGAGKAWHDENAVKAFIQPYKSIAYQKLILSAVNPNSVNDEGGGDWVDDGVWSRVAVL